MSRTIILTKKQIKRLNEYKENNPLDRERYKVLTEAFGQVNNIDEITDEIYNEIINNVKIPQNNKLKNLVTLTTKDGIKYEIPQYHFTTLPLGIKSNYINLALHAIIYDCGNNEQLYRNVINTPQINTYAIGKLIEYVGNNGIELGLRTYLYVYRGQLSLDKNKLKHEITHYYQQIFNPKKPKEYNRQYNNIHQIADTAQYGHIQIATALLYFLMPSEISANMALLRGQMRDLKANRNNYREIFKQSGFFKEYNTLGKYYKILNNSNDDIWENIRIVLQKVDAFHVNSSLSKVPTSKSFRTLYMQYIDKQMKHLDSEVQRVVDYVVGGYTGEPNPNNKENISGRKGYEQKFK